MLPRASVFDLRSIQTPPDYRYFLDTNILFFIFARSFIPSDSYQTRHYPAFLKRLRKEECMVFTFVQNVLELMGVMDKVETELKNLPSIKFYRQAELKDYLGNRKDIYEEIAQSLNIFGIHILPEHVTSYFEIDCSLDVKDHIFILHARDRQTAFVTDDREFIFVEGITIFTANDRALQAARRTGRLRDE